MDIKPNFSLPLDNRIDVFLKEINMLDRKYNTTVPISHTFQIHRDLKKITGKVSLCFVKGISIHNNLAEEIEEIFIKHFPEPDGTPISFFYPCN